MNGRSWVLAAAIGAGLCALAARAEPPSPWTGDLDAAIAGARPVVALVADPSRPCSEAARAAIDAAWRELRPRAARVLLERIPARAGDASALALCVFDRGELAARRDGPLDAELARAWLCETLAQLESERTRAPADAAPGELFARAESCRRRGLSSEAEALFTRVAELGGPPWAARARERLARLAIEAGDVERARRESALAAQAPGRAAPDGAALLTRGLIELAEREHRAAGATLAAAAEALREQRDPDAARARLERARALDACGEGTLALAELDSLRRDPGAGSVRAAARALVLSIETPPTTH